MWNYKGPVTPPDWKHLKLLSKVTRRAIDWFQNMGFTFQLINHNFRKVGKVSKGHQSNALG